MTKSMTIPQSPIEAAEKPADKLQLCDLPFVFIAGGLIGTVYEFMLTLITTGMLEDRTGSILTPFNYVYGIGAVIMVIALYRMTNPIHIFGIGCILGGVVEFGLSFLQEALLGSTSWEYSEKFLNIGGRTTIPYMLVWGGLCLIAVKFVFPALLKLIHKIPEKTRKLIAVVIVGVMCLDAAVTLSANIRFTQRAAGVASQNSVIQLIDSVFDDRYMLTHFPNMMISPD